MFEPRLCEINYISYYVIFLTMTFLFVIISNQVVDLFLSKIGIFFDRYCQTRWVCNIPGLS
jgi:hypothetical protein